MASEWIGYVHFHPSVAAKVHRKHGLQPQAIREAISCGAHENVSWRTDPIYGRRLVVTGTTAEGTGVIAYLRPTDRTDGTWECLTALRLED